MAELRAFQARAKLNLSLDVLGKRPDGYHELRMVMQSSGLCDEVYVELRESGYFMAETNRKYIPSGEKNEAVKAARAFFAAAGLDRGAYIRIEKRIPVCAGLGGGSADAAAVLRALNGLTGANFGAQELRDIAAQVGSDVPFCVVGGACRCQGIGEQVEPVPLLPACWQYFSLFPLEGCAEGVCVQGAFYELDNATLTPDFPIGVSNEWAKNRGPVTVRIDKGALAVICTKAD